MATFDTESGAVSEIKLLYFLSVEINLETGEGLIVPMKNHWLLTAITCAILAVIWAYDYPRWQRPGRLAMGVAYGASTFVLFCILGIATLNYYIPF